MFFKIINRFFFTLFLIIFWFIPIQGIAWNFIGHKIIAQIAYDHLTPQAKQGVNKLITLLVPDYPKFTSFINASFWADTLRYDDVDAFNHWHFINNVFSIDGTVLPSVPQENVVWAIQQAQQVLHSTHANQFERAFFLRFLIHFVGDIHQPLHCTSRVSKAYPLGDEGGNEFPIRSRFASNLHVLWDDGVGLFDHYFDGNKHPTHFQIRQIAQKLERKYPLKFFGKSKIETDPPHWAMESFNIGRFFVYSGINEEEIPSQQYMQKGQQIVEYQIVLAGYRLAYLLNQDF